MEILRSLWIGILTPSLKYILSDSLTSESNRHTVKLLDSRLYNSYGKDNITYNNWLVQIKTKLRGNSDLYLTEDLRIIYVVRCMNSEALALISLHLDVVSYYTYVMVTKLYKHLDEFYGNLNEKRNTC
jgi:hypothetical protein